MKMTHPGSRKTVEVDEDQVANYASQGWVAKAAKAVDPKPAKGDDK